MGSNNQAGTADYGGAIATNNAAQQSFLTDTAQLQPHIYQPDIRALQQSTPQEAAINALNSRALEQQLTPQIAAARTNLNSQVSNDLAGGGQLPAILQAEAIKAGLSGALNAGTAGSAGAGGGTSDTSGTGSTVGNQVYNVLGRNIIDYRNLQQQKAAQLLAANPQPTTNLNIGDLATLQTQGAANAANTQNAWMQQNLGLQQQANVNENSQLQNQMAVTSQQANANASNASAKFGAVIGGLSSLAGSAAGAAKFM
jgi:hypothetical protein